MSNVARVAGQAANTLVKPLNVEEVFSTYLYTGTNTTNNIDNGIDLSGEGGLLWIKNRDAAQKHVLFDTERGKTKMLQTNDTSDELTNAWLDSFNSNGFSIALGVSNAEINNTAYDYTSWTFRKAPKFFDVVTYTGNGTTQTISHNLGTTVGCIIVKRTDSTDNWQVYHRGTDASLAKAYVLRLNLTNAVSYDASQWGNTEPTSTEFTVSGGGTANSNVSGATYVAYLFAHNDGDGDFGPNGDADIIKCGSYTGNGTSQEIDLGFEAQWVLIKNTTNTQSWAIIDNMRGFTVEGVNDQILTPNDSTAEAPDNRAFLTSSGFGVNSADYRYNGSGSNYIYIAIRRGPMAVPESATDVFAVDTSGGDGDGVAPYYRSGFPVDMAIRYRKSQYTFKEVRNRLTGDRALYTNSTTDEQTDNNYTPMFAFMNGYYNRTSTESPTPSILSAMWRRAPNYFDVVAYQGDGTTGRTVSHNLGVAPEMMWVKRRDGARSWAVYHSSLGSSSLLALEKTDAAASGSTVWNSDPTASVLNLDNSFDVNGSGADYIAYLFASLDGVSKVGSYTGNGSTQTIDCGFSSGARFVLIKRTDSTGDWYIWDTERGIVAGNDPHISLNNQDAEVTTDDSIDPVSSGFAVNQVSATNINVSSATYIFYAIA